MPRGNGSPGGVPGIGAVPGGNGSNGLLVSCRLKVTATGAWTQNTGANIQLQQTAWALDKDNTDGLMWRASKPGELIAPVTGVYWVSWGVFPLDTFQWYTVLAIRINNLAQKSKGYPGTTTGDWWSRDVGGTMALNAGDIATAWMESRGGPRDTLNDASYTHFTMTQVG